MEPVKATTLSLNVLAVAFISFCTCAPIDTIFGENGLVFTNNTEHQQKQPINPGKFAVSISGKGKLTKVKSFIANQCLHP